MRSRTVVLLDVDGVLAPFLPGDSTDFTDWVAAGPSTVMSPTVGRRLAALDADVVWLTTHQDGANALTAAAYGWPPHRALRRPARSTGWWKLAAALECLTGSEARVVWADDQLREHPDAAEELAAHVGELLAVCPDPATGLTAAELDRIEAFVGQRDSATAAS